MLWRQWKGFLLRIPPNFLKLCFLGNFFDFPFSVPCSFHTTFSPYCYRRRDFHVLLPCHNLNYKNQRRATVGQNMRSSLSLLPPKESKSRAKIYNTFESSPWFSPCLVSSFLCISVIGEVECHSEKLKKSKECTERN